MTYVHPARFMRYTDLIDGLRDAIDKKLVSEKADGDLRLYNYTPAAVYEKAWTPITLVARGIVLDVRRQAVLATPFEKFFNHGERGDATVPDLPFEVFEKLDGSLIVVWHDGGGWRASTRGSFNSKQAVAAFAYLAQEPLIPGNTYLFEWVAPDNRVVVRYDRPELVLLAVYGPAGNELSYPEETAAALGTRAANRHAFASISDLIVRAAGLPVDEEGYVVRFWNGLRLKIKGDEYRRVHALISGCTPLGLWRAMEAGDDLALIRQRLPEEFWGDFDAIVSALSADLHSIEKQVASLADRFASFTDKQVGLELDEVSPSLRPFIFPYRKTGGNLLSHARTRATVFRYIRPNGNVIPGYVPSYAMNRVQEN